MMNQFEVLRTAGTTHLTVVDTTRYDFAIGSAASSKQSKGKIMQSAWEKLTDGRCNNTEPLDDGCTRKPLTARQLKEQAKLSMKSANNKFKRADALVKLEKQGLIGPKERRKLSDRWDKRTSNNATGFYDAKAARAAKRSGAVL